MKKEKNYLERLREQELKVKKVREELVVRAEQGGLEVKPEGGEFEKFVEKEKLKE